MKRSRTKTRHFLEIYCLEISDLAHEAKLYKLSTKAIIYFLDFGGILENHVFKILSDALETTKNQKLSHEKTITLKLHKFYN